MCLALDQKLCTGRAETQSLEAERRQYQADQVETLTTRPKPFIAR